MSDMTHTPGPWEINPAEPTQIMTSEKPHELICRTPPKLYANRAEANAHLIASAPDMLDALERTLANFVRLLEQKPVRDAAETIAEAERALSKARAKGGSDG